MRTLRILLAAAAVAGATVLGATAASAQAWAYDAATADHAYWRAHHQADQARHDQSKAEAAAYWGNYAAADHYARSADRHRLQAARDAGFARHEDHVAGWEYRHRGWGY